MKYQLMQSAQDKGNSVLEQILLNRGIKQENLKEYIDEDGFKYVNEPERLGKDKMREAVKMVARHIKNNDKTIIIVDPDVDGNTSSALLLNYFYKLFPAWTENIKFYFHTGKQHGLNDCIDYILDNNYKFVLIPDAGSNDRDECATLQKYDIDVLILDHHDFDKENPYALIINNQEGYSDYPNKALSGVGVVWQFCRYFDSIMMTNYAMDFMDLVAIGLVGDMMDMRSVETKALINRGLKRLTNPFMFYMAQKNAFKLGEQITPIGAAFYIVPLLNAVQRSGTYDEKKLVFESMLTYKAFEQIESTKRGHKAGETEQLVEQAVRTASNVKNRQTRVQDAAIEELESQIEREHLLDHKVLLLLLEDNNIPAEVRGLIANKFMAKYQRPCCLLSNNQGMYQGSARGCSVAGVLDFKQICLDTGKVDYAVGHPNAFGLQLREEAVPAFLSLTDEVLKDMSNEAIYYVDYIFKGKNVDGSVILQIADMANYWGSEINEPFVAVEHLKVTSSMVEIYRKTTNTIKISLDNGISIMKFNADEELCEKLTTNNTGYMEMDIVGKCNKNEWCGNVTPQIFIEDFNITDSNKYYF